MTTKNSISLVDTRGRSKNNTTPRRSSSLVFLVGRGFLILCFTVIFHLLYYHSQHFHHEYHQRQRGGPRTGLFLDSLFESSSSRRPAVVEVGVQPESFKSLYGDTSSSQTIIFYTIYIPLSHNVTGEQRAISIVKEQVAQIANLTKPQQLPLYTNGRREPTVHIYYTLIGKESLNESAMEDLCTTSGDHIRCSRLAHHDKGNEDLTLQRLYQFCSNSPDPDTQRVTYMHSKGAFHHSADDVNWRRSLVAGTLHQDCLNPPNDTCNVCGLQFYPISSFFFPGNFWTAQCSYIEKLLPPATFEPRLRSVTEAILYSNNTQPVAVSNTSNISWWANKAIGKIGTTLYTPAPWNLGYERFAAEVWIGSHPDLVPCTLSESHYLREFSTLRNYTNLHASPIQVPSIAAAAAATTTATNSSHLLSHSNRSTQPITTTNGAVLSFGMAPRQRLDSRWFRTTPSRVRRLLRTKDDRMREFYLLPGQLLNWDLLYGRLPHQDSWIWRYFPDGDFFQQQSTYSA